MTNETSALQVFAHLGKDSLADLNAFLAVAEHGSFTKASIALQTSQSTLSHAMRRLEDRLGVRLLNRTTRSVSTTEAGSRLAQILRESFGLLSDGLLFVKDLGNEPSGRLRIASPALAFTSLLWPALSKYTERFPKVSVEVDVDPAKIDVVAGGYDAAIRLGEDIDQDMVSIPIGGPMRMVVVASPGYMKQRSPPADPTDLSQHDCISYRRPMSGRVSAWKFEREGRVLRFKPSGRLMFNSTDAILAAALEGKGVALLPEMQVADGLSNGMLHQYLEDWCHPVDGFRLYYPSRRQPTAAMRALIDCLRS